MYINTHSHMDPKTDTHTSGGCQQTPDSEGGATAEKQNQD